MMEIANMTSEEITSRLIMSVINYEENKSNIAHFPYIKKGNFAILAQFCVGEKNDSGQYTACLTVTDSMLEQWGFEKKSLFDIAADNSRILFPSVCEPLEKYLDFSRSEVRMMLPDGVVIPNVMVLTNEFHFNGAATLFYDPERINHIAEQLNSEKLILMPSSVNQIYCISQKNRDDLKIFQDLYQELAEMTDKEKMLSDSILTYDANTKTVTEAIGNSYTLDLNETVARHRGR